MIEGLGHKELRVLDRISREGAQPLAEQLTKSVLLEGEELSDKVKEDASSPWIFLIYRNPLLNPPVENGEEGEEGLGASGVGLVESLPYELEEDIPSGFLLDPLILMDQVFYLPRQEDKG